MSAILERVRNRAIHKSGFAVARQKDLAYADPKARLVDEDEAEPYARFVISTRDVDGSGDVLEPKGCLKHLDRFRRNPVWYYDHYDPQTQQRLKFPIGKADGPAGTAGKLDIEVSDDEITLGCWFSQDTQEARDVYQLVKNRFLRCPSVSFLPRHAEKIKSTGGYHYLEWELTEVSIVGVPDNPFTGLLELKSLESPTLRRSWSNGASLEPDMPADKIAAVQFSKSLWTKERALEWLKKQGHDATLCEDLDGKLVFHQPDCDAESWGQHKSVGKGLVTILSVQKAKAKEDEKEQTADNKKDDATEGDKGGKGKTDEKAGDKDQGKKDTTDGGDKEGGDKDAELPPGMKCLKDLHGHHKGVHSYCTKMLDHIEHPDVTKCLKKQIEHAANHMEDIKNLAGKAYPDADFGKVTEEESGGGADGKDERSEEQGDNAQNMETTETTTRRTRPIASKALRRHHKSVCADAAGHLEAMAESEMHKALNRAHLFHAKCLREYLEQSESPTPRQKDMDGDDSGAGDDFGDVAKALTSLHTILNGAIAAKAS